MATHDTVIEEYRGFHIHRLDYAGDGAILYQGRKGTENMVGFCYTFCFWEVENVKLCIDQAMAGRLKLRTDIENIDDADEGPKNYKGWTVKVDYRAGVPFFKANMGYRLARGDSLSELHQTIDDIMQDDQRDAVPDQVLKGTASEVSYSPEQAAKLLGLKNPPAPMLPATEINLLIPDFNAMYGVDWRIECFRHAVCELVLKHFTDLPMHSTASVLKAVASNMDAGHIPVAGKPGWDKFPATDAGKLEAERDKGGRLG